MKVRIFGNATALTVEEMRYAIRYYARRLMGKELIPQVRAVVHLMDGYPHQAECYPNRLNEPDKFRIFLDTRGMCSRRSQLIALSHEMVHVKQFAMNELKLASTKAVWRQEIVPEDCFDYKELPWEKEAYGLEHALYHDYRGHLNSLDRTDRKRLKSGRYIGKPDESIRTAEIVGELAVLSTDGRVTLARPAAPGFDLERIVDNWRSDNEQT